MPPSPASREFISLASGLSIIPAGIISIIMILTIIIIIIITIMIIIIIIITINIMNMCIYIYVYMYGLSIIPAGMYLERRGRRGGYRGEHRRPL